MTPLRERLVRMPVPPVRPLLRRTIKRFLRLLPSILLLLFVISLIFVTLMQIAVIHTHRRLQRTTAPQQTPQLGGPQLILTANQSSVIKLLELERHSVSTTTTIATTNTALSAVNRMLKSDTNPNSNTVPTQQKITKKSEVLRIEALLDKNLPSIEANTQVLQNFVNSGRIRKVIEQFNAIKPVMNISTIIETIGRHTKQTNHYNNSYNNKNIFKFMSSKNIRPNSETNNETKSFLSVNDFNYDFESDQQLGQHYYQPTIDRNHSNIQSEDRHLTIESSVKVLSKLYKSKPICPSVPPELIGRVRVEAHINIDEKMSQIVKMNPELKLGGFWEPANCYSRHRVAVIIPFRDRNQHLSILLYHLHPILRRQQLSYKIYVIEQYGSDTFNKGVLMNVGVREALKENDFHCFVFHDVDLIPEDDRNLYSCPFAPRHMSVSVDKFNYTLPYSELVGGVLSITKTNFMAVNGYSNLYWGWGGEDDDMAHRLRFHNLHIIRPPESIGRYTMIKHNHRPESPNNVRSALLRMAKRRAFRDGLGSVRYKVVFKHYEKCYTHIMVEIGHIHKWHFPSPNKLVLHFK